MGCLIIGSEARPRLIVIIRSRKERYYERDWKELKFQLWPYEESPCIPKLIYSFERKCREKSIRALDLVAMGNHQCMILLMQRSRSR